MVTFGLARITLLVVYRSGSVPPSAEFFHEIDTVASKTVVSSDILLITGDLNVRLDRPTDPHAITFSHVLNNFQLRQHVTDATHSLGGTLDVVISHEDYPIQTPSAVFVPVSDHLLVEWTLSVTKPDIVLRTTTSRNWKAFNEESFCSALAAHFPDAESAPAHAAAIADVDALVAFYDSTISALLDQHAPKCDVTFRERRSNDWFGDACHDAKLRSRYLERQFQRTRCRSCHMGG